MRFSFFQLSVARHYTFTTSSDVEKLPSGLTRELNNNLGKLKGSFTTPRVTSSIGSKIALQFMHAAVYPVLGRIPVNSTVDIRPGPPRPTQIDVSYSCEPDAGIASTGNLLGGIGVALILMAISVAGTKGSVMDGLAVMLLGAFAAGLSLLVRAFCVRCIKQVHRQFSDALTSM